MLLPMPDFEGQFWEALEGKQHLNCCRKLTGLLPGRRGSWGTQKGLLWVVTVSEGFFPVFFKSGEKIRWFYWKTLGFEGGGMVAARGVHRGQCGIIVYYCEMNILLLTRYDGKVPPDRMDANMMIDQEKLLRDVLLSRHFGLFFSFPPSFPSSINP